MELYKEYLLEREDTYLYYDEDSFITYEFIDNFCYIKDVYVCLNKRRTGKASFLGKMVEDIARAKGKQQIMGSVCISARGWQNSLALMYKEGYTFKQAINDMIYLIKDL